MFPSKSGSLSFSSVAFAFDSMNFTPTSLKLLLPQPLRPLHFLRKPDDQVTRPEKNMACFKNRNSFKCTNFFSFLKVMRNSLPQTEYMSSEMEWGCHLASDLQTFSRHLSVAEFSPGAPAAFPILHPHRTTPHPRPYSLHRRSCFCLSQNELNF